MSTAPQGNFDFSRYGPGSGGRERKGPPGVAGRNLQKLFDKLPPHSPESEMCLLGSMILDHRVASEVIPLVPSGDFFYSTSHAAIFDALVKTYDIHRSGDLVQLMEALRDKGVLEEVGGQEYLLQLAESVPSAVNAPHYARIVREKAQLRRLIDAAGQMLYDAYHSGELSEGGAREVMDRAEQMIFQIAEDAVGADAETLSVLLQETLTMLDALAQSGRTITGIATGFFDLDEMTSGLQSGELVIVAARPSMGKTAFALNLAEQVAFGGSPHEGKHAFTPVGFFSMEMSRQSVTQRLLCAHSGVDSHKMRRNMMSQDDFKRLAMSCGVLSDAPIIIDDTPGLTVLQLRAKARRMKSQHQIRCLIVDYLQLMSAPSAARESRQAEVSAISRGIKALARELEIPIVCLAQLNRAAEQREGNRPRMADLRESGSIEQDADVIMLLHREEYYHAHQPQWSEENPDKVGVAEVIIAKQRNGPTGTVELKWDAPATRFRNLSRHSGGSGGHRPVFTPGAGAGAGSEGSGGESRVARQGFAPGSRSGPVADHRDGGGPDREDGRAPWEDGDVDDVPV
ncbi:MAG: replicative DNA helicase [Planctomycetota bacterium]|nr:replicative DNA helicase [Planctomycetota bacterium]